MMEAAFKATALIGVALIFTFICASWFKLCVDKEWGAITAFSPFVLVMWCFVFFQELH